MLKPGTKVRWWSQAQGSWVEKVGTVVAHIAANTSAWRLVPEGTAVGRYHMQDISEMDRYLVAVTEIRDDCGKIKRRFKAPHYYAPPVARLEK